MTKMKTAVDEYIENYTDEEQTRLKALKEIIKKAAPKAEEKISWAMPTFTLNGKNMIHFAVHKNHIGLYPGVTAIEKFQDKLADYKTSKGAIQLPMSKPLPMELIKEIAEFQAKELSN